VIYANALSSDIDFEKVAIIVFNAVLGLIAFVVKLSSK